jgi:hypothetical protein
MGRRITGMAAFTQKIVILQAVDNPIRQAT